MEDFLSVQNNKVILATCNLNQWALDFDGNLSRIIESITIAKHAGARYRIGPELELSGYSCEDHYFEMDTFMHCEQSLAALLHGECTTGILCDIGCPILHNNVRYNCRVFCLDGKIVLIRPKCFLADDGNYREKRYFASWDISNTSLEAHPLPDLLRKVTGQITAPFGLGIIATEETTIASEICEELWAPRSPHTDLYLSGVEIISNGSGSHHELRKLNSRLNLIRNASKTGGVYLFANQRGCDGNRLYFDGCSLIALNGEVLAQASQFSLDDCEVITAVVDLDAVRAFRQTAASSQEQASRTSQWTTINLRSFSLRANTPLPCSLPLEARIHTPEEECCLGPACWLWDYLRRSGAAGFLLPLSGGADSSSVAGIVRVMAELVAKAAEDGNEQVIADLKRIFTNNRTTSAVLTRLNSISLMDLSRPLTPVPAAEKVVQLANEITYQVLHSVYMGTTHSSMATQSRAATLASEIHSYHNTLFIDEIVTATLKVFSLITGRVPAFLSAGGSMAEDLALQNIQARLRMVMAYLCAQLLPWLRGSSGFLLVLGSANVDEALRGYMTKYDCSSADINPIGGMCKGDLKRMLLHIATAHSLPVLAEIANAAPTAELRPSNGGSEQLDEEDMGMTYAELGIFGRLRKISQAGPVKMFIHLLEQWTHLTPKEVADKVKRFFRFYAINRHKATVSTPAYHAEGYSPDDNRFDLRPFLYNTKWTRQFNTMDSIVASKG